MRPLRALTRYVSRYERGGFAAAIAGPYALIVVAATVYVAISTQRPGSQGLEAIVLFAVTSPLSMLLMFLPLASLADDPPGPQIFLLSFTAAGLFQAWLLWRITRGRAKDKAQGPPTARPS
ncbi:hypothetical protein F5972_04100 [Microbispora cellulosiformans]|uniref:Uncharacterized protein n=1 Tax=Microbispora cellulosiformans TaxID=2614688 RepID=A0A5J5KCK4_9ACTN|nr:hypothetical protein [Microbispora cellulosiformans]KAA9381993.1 hypothetical protein F5972_04100 [Microbispora cellulosiformans]